MTRPIVALDIGGTSVKSGLVDGGEPASRLIVTPVVRDAPADAIVDRWAHAITAVTSGVAADRLGVAAAVPDPFDHAAGVSQMTHKYGALYGMPIAPLVEAALGRPVEMRWCNDAAAAVAGEAYAGAGRGRRAVLGVTLGTGLGAALIVDGAVVPAVGDAVVGDLWRTVLADGRSADTAFAARTLLAALDEGPSGGTRFGRELGALLAPLAREARVDVVVVGGGGAGSFDAIASTLGAAVGVPVARAQLGPWAALLGAVRLCFGDGSGSRRPDPAAR